MSKFLHSLKNLKQSSFYKSLQERYANNMGYRQLGLRLDDLVPDEGPIVQEALRRLTPNETYDRIFRFRRAFALSASHKELPEKEWTTAETDIAYLAPVINQVEMEIETKLNFDRLDNIPKALLYRNRSTL